METEFNEEEERRREDRDLRLFQEIKRILDEAGVEPEAKARITKELAVRLGRGWIQSELI